MVHNVQMGDSVLRSALPDEHVAALIAGIATIDPSMRRQPGHDRRERLGASETDSEVDDRLGEQVENRGGAHNLDFRLEAVKSGRHLAPQLDAGVQPGLGRSTEPQSSIVEAETRCTEEVHGPIVSSDAALPHGCPA